MKTILVALCGLPLALSGQTISKEMQARIDSAQRMEVIAKQEQERVKNLKPLPIEQIRANLAKREAEARAEKEKEARHQYYVKLLKDSQTAPNPNKKQVPQPVVIKPGPNPIRKTDTQRMIDAVEENTRAIKDLNWR